MEGELVVLLDKEEPYILKSGQYAFWAGCWWGVPPGTELLANLEKHKVTVHEDGKITISPSILVSNRDQSWHGYLEHGVWRQC